MWKIRKSFLEDLCAAAQNYYPNEFMCFLGGNKAKMEIEEIVFLPTTSGRDYASVFEGIIPFDEKMIGCFHSHPHGTNKPSRQDKNMFQKYEINAIIGWPFKEGNIAFYDSKGEKVEPKVLY